MNKKYEKRVVIAGGRDFGNRLSEAGGLDLTWQRKCVAQMDASLELLFAEQIEWGGMLVVSGHARGADQMGEMWADAHMVDVKLYPADWDTHGKGAGPIRNREMAQNADVLVTFFDGYSSGTRHMIEMGLMYDLEIHVIRYERKA